MSALSKKVCLLGDYAVGKTSMVRRFLYDRFDDKYMATIGVKVSRKTVAVVQENEVVDLTMMLWDLAGSEEFDHVRISYLRGSAGALLVCDLTRPNTLESLSTYARNLLSVNSNARLVMAANKSDLVNEQQVTLAQVKAVAAELDVPVYVTSAKTGDEVEAAFRHLGRLLLAS